MLLAKSPARGGLSLTTHLLQTSVVAEVLADAWNMDVRLAGHGGLLHDPGKAHPAYVAMIAEHSPQVLTSLPKEYRALVEQELVWRSDRTAAPHRHELSSLLFLPLFDRADWPALVDMVVGHHKSVDLDFRGRGLLDLVDTYGEARVFARHFEGWSVWAPSAIEALKATSRIGHAIAIPSKDQAQEAFAWVCRYVETRPAGWSRWRGLLMTADHMASGLEHRAEEMARSSFRVPDLSCFARPSPRTPSGIALYPLADKPSSDPRPHTLVIAPTGSGKTDLLLRRCRGRVFYALPYQASINAMYLRIGEALSGIDAGADVRRVHGASRVPLPDGDLEDVEMQTFPGAGVKVMTPHQLAGLAFGIPGHEALAMDIEGQDVILDEVHVYEEGSQALVFAIVNRLVALGARVHIGTATMPSALRALLLDALGGDEQVHEITLSAPELATYRRHRVHHLSSEADARERVATLVAQGKSVIFVSNQVARAQERFEWARSTLQAPILLIHSRFRRKDRAALERRVADVELAHGPFVLCATQVIEVSLDISADAMVTDAAPLDVLLQRFGRVHRRRTAAGLLHRADVWVLCPEEPGWVRPYEADLVKASIRQLPEGHVVDPTQLQSRLDAVFPTVDITRITPHLLYHDGAYQVDELRDHPSGRLAAILDFHGATCVLSSDVDAYLDADWQERPLFEIPVDHRSLWACRDQLPVLDVASRPFVVNARAYSPEFGLDLTQNILPTGPISDRTL